MEFFEDAKWIGSGLRVVTRTTGEQSPALQFRRELILENTGRAECRISGLGCFVLYINGQRVGDEVLSPAFTDYDKRVLYCTYDVTSLLRKGRNVVAVCVGDGFYNQTTHDTWGFYQAPWRDTAKLLLSLQVEGRTVLVSDESWKQTLEGATVHNAIRTGEYYDARREDGWKETGYDDSRWNAACVVAPPAGKLAPQQLPPIRECEVLPAVDLWKSEKGWIFDFGKNIAGYVSLRMAGNAGQTVSIRYSEKLSGRELDQSNISCYVLDTPDFSVDKYTFRGEGTECWKPSFVYHGFRYAELTGVTEAPDRDALTACFVHTDLPQKGSFRCSDELLNWIQEAGIRSFLSNFHGISEDCPHREKNGWTGDAVISAGYAVCQFDMAAAYRKWLADIADSQRINGQLPGIAPTGGWGHNWGSGPAWDCALFFLPWELYLETGDTSCFDVVYEAAQRYLDYARYYRKDGLVCYGLSDWCPPDLPDLKLMDNRLSDSCYYYAMQMIMAKMALLAGEAGKADAYRREALETRRAIADRYIQGSSVDNDGQGALAEVLYFSIVEGEQAQKIAARLARTVEAEHYQFRVGILGMKALLNALSKYGYTDVAYRMVNREDYPSYGYWKELGATTFWECWENTSFGSQNHHMYADVLNWMFRNIGGLQNAGIAYDKCVLRPYFFREKCSAEVETETPRGKIRFAWKKEGTRFTAEILLPEGTEAVLELPGRAAIRVENGDMEIRL